jgi:phosphoribosylformylglycinamidine synthase
VVAEALLNLACVGARPLGLVNCLNFGNPEHPEVMWQLSEAIDGMAEACRAFGVPVVGGNVSLYNESRGQDIDPTPVVGVVGVIDQLEERPPGVRLEGGGVLLALGHPARSLAGSRWAWAKGAKAGPAPYLDLDAHRAVTDLVRGLVADGRLTGVHDTADGLAVALAEMAASSGTGFVVEAPDADHEWLFAESPSRVVACVGSEGVDDVLRAAEAAGVQVTRLGVAGGDRLVVRGLVDVSLAQATDAWRGRLPGAIGAGAVH